MQMLCGNEWLRWFLDLARWGCVYASSEAADGMVLMTQGQCCGCEQVGMIDIRHC
jgi:hypothetical protein